VIFDNRGRAGIDVNNRPTSICADDLETIDPYTSDLDQSDGDDIAGHSLACDAHDIVKSVYVAALIKFAGKIMVGVIIGAGAWRH